MALFRYHNGAWPNVLAILYVLLAYSAGFVAIVSSNWLLNSVGVVLLAHSMIIAAYLIHECAHNTIFKNVHYNAVLGRILNWLTGGCYGDYASLQHKHFRHHVDKADVVAFDYRMGLKQHPVLLRLMKVLEWCYIPALDIMMHSLQIIMPFSREYYKAKRLRVITVLLIRGSLFGLLAWYSPEAILYYVVAYFIMMHVLRFMDAFQHTYVVFETLQQERGEEAKQFDRDYEHANTYSNFISVKYPVLNLLVLNFCYHNAHHYKQAVPWHNLPALHAEQYGDDDSQLIPFKNQLISYHNNRVARLDNDAAESVGSGRDKGRYFVGVDGVNFLTAF